jgi:hypothetical protein
MSLLIVEILGKQHLGSRQNLGLVLYFRMCSMYDMHLPCNTDELRVENLNQRTFRPSPIGYSTPSTGDVSQLPCST